MHRFVRYNLKTGEITGQFTTSSDEFVPLPISDEEGQVEIKDEEHLKQIEQLSPARDRIRGKVVEGAIQRLRREPVYATELELSADLDDRDGDGVLDAPADGKTGITIRASLMRDGKPVTGGKPVSVRFRTTRGTLSRRTVETVEGIAEVSLTAIAETTAGVVTATAEGGRPGSLTIEFVPVAEYADTGPSKASRGSSRKRSAS